MGLFGKKSESVLNSTSATAGMTRSQKIWVGSFIILTILTLGFLVVSTVQVKDKKERGESYTTTIAPGSPGEQGEKGEKGDQGPPPTPEQIKTAVYQYCAETGVCDGQQPSLAVVFAAVTKFCDNGACKGESGKNGKDGRDVTATDIQTAVNNYCANGNCKGSKGETGSTGPAGSSGSNGKTPLINCVIRTSNNVATRYVAWKYSDQANSEYKDLYKLPTWAECLNPVDLRA